MGNLFDVTYAIVFQKDGLDETIFNDLDGSYGKFVRKEEYELEDGTSVVVGYMKGSVVDYTWFKSRFCCAEPRKHILFPMASEEDKIAIEKEWSEQS